MIGTILIYIVFASLLTSSVLYYVSTRKDSYISAARLAYIIGAFGIVFISGYFLSLILSHQFQYTYIWSYSNKQLPLWLLASTFFAGQEGSFLLWVLFFAVIGIILLYSLKGEKKEPYSMFFYVLIIIILLALLLAKSPFEYVWETFKDAPQGFTPKDGRGLNPILENFWMTIHPPILFVGYALTAVPYVLALNSLITKDYDGWVKKARPWALAATGVLGAGIALGAFWSYETLGWGGFWGWDPVENASLIPWLVLIAFVHTLQIQKRTGDLVKTNYVLAILSFALVIYATFLTRSGVLGDISVHSFVAPGRIVYALLLAAIILIIGVAAVILLSRLKDLKSEEESLNYNSKEFFIVLGSITILLLAVIVFIGANYPLFLDIAGKKKFAVEISYYNQWSLPISLVMLILCAFSTFISWRFSKLSADLSKTAVAGLFSIALALAIAILTNSVNFKTVALAFASLFCFATNIQFLFKRYAAFKKTIGAHLGHIGLAIFLFSLSILISSTREKTVSLPQNETKSALGYELTYLGSSEIEKQLTDREKYKCQIKIEKSGEFDIETPIVQWSDFNKRQSPFFEPGIKTSLFKDIYFSPVSLRKESAYPEIKLNKKQKRFLNDSSISIELLGFDMSAGGSPKSENNFILGAIVVFADSLGSQTDTLYSVVNLNSGEVKPNWTENEKLNKEISFSNFELNRANPSKSAAYISIKDKGLKKKKPKEIFVVQISEKPGVFFIWIGMILIFASFIIAIINKR